MKNLLSLTVGIGSTSREPVPDQLTEFYEWVATTIAKDECRKLNTNAESFLPISNREMQHKPKKIEAAVKRLFDLHEGPTDVLLINISGPYSGPLRGQLLPNLASQIVVLSARAEKLVTILLLNELPSKGDLCLRILQSLTDQQRVVLIESSGLHCPLSVETDADFQYDYRTKLGGTKTQPIELLRSKLVRRLGHFKWFVDGKHVACSRYYYDGSQCTSQIVSLLREKLDAVATQKRRKVNAIVYLASFSPWLEQALIVLHEQVHIDIYSIDEFENCQSFRGKPSNILLIAGLVNTGNTLAEAYRAVKRKSPRSQVTPFSILTSAMGNEGTLTRNIVSDDLAFEVECLHKVELKPIKPQECELCALGFPQSRPQREDYDLLTTFDMWMMNDDAGFKPESDVPPGRPGYDFVPDFAKMAQIHGAWIVYKFRLLLKSRNLSDVDLVVVCPAQKGPKALSPFLKHLLSVDTIIEIPSPFLKRLLEKRDDREKLIRETLSSSQEDWAKNLKTVTNDSVVILDEFRASGTTLDTIHSIVTASKKRVQCYMPIVDFSPKRSAMNNVPTLSLYQIQRAG